MLSECLDQAFLREYAYKTTSCGRFKTYSLSHCGRCVPCLVRRAAFLSCNVTDATKYVYAADLRVHLENPYQLKTKGEMLSECLDQAFLREYAYKTTSCGRFKTYSLTHCGRCVPCLVRRAAFLSCNVTDATKYVYADIGMDDES